MSMKYRIYLTLWLIACVFHIIYLCIYEREIFAVGSEWLIYFVVSLIIGLKGIEDEESKN